MIISSPSRLAIFIPIKYLSVISVFCCTNEVVAIQYPHFKPYRASRALPSHQWLPVRGTRYSSCVVRHSLPLLPGCQWVCGLFGVCSVVSLALPVVLLHVLILMVVALLERWSGQPFAGRAEQPFAVAAGTFKTSNNGVQRAAACGSEGPRRFAHGKVYFHAAAGFIIHTYLCALLCPYQYLYIYLDPDLANFARSRFSHDSHDLFRPSALAASFYGSEHGLLSAFQPGGAIGRNLTPEIDLRRPGSAG